MKEKTRKLLQKIFYTALISGKLECNNALMNAQGKYIEKLNEMKFSFLA